MDFQLCLWLYFSTVGVLSIQPLYKISSTNLQCFQKASPCLRVFADCENHARVRAKILALVCIPMSRHLVLCVNVSNNWTKFKSNFTFLQGKAILRIPTECVQAYLGPTMAYRRGECCETHQNNNITHNLCQSTCILKYGPSPSRVYCIPAKSTNRNFQFPYCSSHGQVTFLKHCYWLVG